MKRSMLPLVAFCLSITAFSAVSRAESSPIRIRVEATNKLDPEKTKTTQTRVLNVTLDNSSAEPQELKVKFAVFGRDVSSRDIVTVGQGEVPVTVKGRGSEKVQTTEAKASSDDPKPAANAKGGGKKAEPTGQKIVGHGVQVFKGDTMVAEFYEPASMKASFGTATAVKPAEAKK